MELLPLPRPELGHTALLRRTLKSTHSARGFSRRSRKVRGRRTQMRSGMVAGAGASEASSRWKGCKIQALKRASPTDFLMVFKAVGARDECLKAVPRPRTFRESICITAFKAGLPKGNFTLIEICKGETAAKNGFLKCIARGDNSAARAQSGKLAGEYILNKTRSRSLQRARSRSRNCMEREPDRFFCFQSG